jgi:hypothetical protein
MKAPSRVFLAMLIPLAVAFGRLTGPKAPDPQPIPDPVFIAISSERIVLTGFREIPLKFIRVVPSKRLVRLRMGPGGGCWIESAILGHENQGDIQPGPEMDSALKSWTRTNSMGGLIL